MTFSRNPIHHIEGRVKSPASIIDKLKKKNAEISLLSAKENINDLAGIRIVCCFIDDVYRVEEMLMRQPDIVLEKRQDYIKNPQLQWLPFPAFRPTRSSLSFRPHRKRADRSTVEDNCYGLLGKS